MRILLIKPPPSRNQLTLTRGEPLELEYLASSVKDHPAEILDMRIDKNLQKKLEKFKPDFVGITAYSCEANTAREVLKEVKKSSREIRTGIGGHHATFIPNDFALPFVDVIFLGLSDVSFREYIGVMEKGKDTRSVSNIAIVNGNELHYTEQKQIDLDLNLLPLPARHLTLHYRSKYRDAMRNRVAFVLASRGCPFRCTFCACWKIMNGKYITRNPESIVEEIAGLPEDIDLVSFADDNTLHHTSRVRRFSEMMRERKINKKFSMYARADTIVKHPDLIESLRDAGLEYLTVGIESFKDSELDKFNKKTSVQMNNEAIKILQRFGVSISAHFIVNPDYTPEDFKQLFRYVCDRGLFRPTYAILTPLPGTELFLINHDRLVIKDYDFYDFAHSIFPTKLSRKEFYRQYADIYKKTYSFQRYFKSKLKDLFSLFVKATGSMKRNVDRMSLFRMLLVHIFAYPHYLRAKKSYKSEPLISSFNP